MVKLEHASGVVWINPMAVLKVHGTTEDENAGECTVTMVSGSTYKVRKPVKKVIALLKK